MKYYTKAELLELQKSGTNVIIESNNLENTFFDDFFVEIWNKNDSFGNSIRLKIINRDEIKNIKGIVSKCGEISANCLKEKTNIDKSVNDSINALLQKKVIKEENGVYKKCN